jgi:hypothetical protein
MKSTAKIISAFLLLATFINNAKAENYDLVVYGGSSSGVIAAYTAAEEGLNVALLETRAHIGGLTTSGLGHVDIGDIQTIGGYTKEFLLRAGQHYGLSNKVVTDIECSVSEQIFLQMLQENKVPVFYNSRLKAIGGVQKQGNSIQSITLENGSVFNARIFIDASYEGDLMAQSGVSYAVGREAIADYNESSAGIQSYKLVRRYNAAELQEIQTLKNLFPLDYVFAEQETVGGGDSRVQAYCYRLCVTTNTANQRPFSQPQNYHPARYNLILSRINKSQLYTLDKVLTLYKLPNQKFDVNHIDLVNASWEYPEASYERRLYLENYHKEYQQGLLYFLANDENVPEQLRNDTKRYGYAKDEFADNGNFPYLLYVREARRMLGQVLMKQQDAWDTPFKSDAIGIGSYFMDSHTVERFITSAGEMWEEGEMKHAPYRPYEIPYGAIAPKQTECANLLVTVCLSATHTIYGSLRMEPIFMVAGQAAAVAASLAIGGNTAVQQINMAQLQQRLTSQGQILHYNSKEEFYIDRNKYSGIVLDDEDAVFQGNWSHSVAAGPFLMYSYRFAQQAATETASARYPLDLPEDGTYEVQLMYSPASNRSKAARIVVSDSEGDKEALVDMTLPFTAPNYWRTIGTYRFSKDKNPKITVSNQGGDGIVIADGLRLVNTSQTGIGRDKTDKSPDVYPNPVDETLYFGERDESKTDSISVYNLCGQIVKTATLAGNSMNVSDLSKGYYLFQIGNTKGKFLKK